MSGLPEVVRLPVAQPNFILGVLFVLIILFLPGGFASLVTARSERTFRASRTAGARTKTSDVSLRTGSREIAMRRSAAGDR